jgi:hypothetical protein
MPETPNLGLTYLAAAQAQKHVTVNEALRRLDALVQIAVLDRDLAAPPPAPPDGARYLVAAAATGAWAGKGGEIAAFQDGAWAFLAPKPGWLVFVADEPSLLVRAGAAWIEVSPAASTVPKLGILATADATNRLSVKSNAALFSHDDLTPGSGDMRVSVNKSAAAKDAALVFQDGYLARALLGLLGSDDLTVKVSADGATWKTAVVVDKAAGSVSLPLSPRFSATTGFDNYVAANAWTKVQFNTADHNAQNAFQPAANRFVAPFAGTFHLAAAVGFKANAALPSAMEAAFRLNGATIARSARIAAPLVSMRTGLVLDELLLLAQGDGVEVAVRMEANDGYVDLSRSGFRGHHVP